MQLNRIMKKLIIFICITAFINFIGCSSTGVITLNDLKYGSPSDISILTKDNKSYILKSDNYRIEQDSLFINGIMVDSTSKPIQFKGKIAFQDIEIINGTQIDGGKTILLILGVGALALIIFFAAVAGSAVGSLFDWQ